MTQKIVSGILFSLDTTRKNFEEASLKMKALIIILFVLGFLFLMGLFSLATNSHSGVGVPIIVTTFVIGMAIFLTRLLENNLVRSKRLNPRIGILFFVGISALMCGFASVAGMTFLPTLAGDIPVAISVGSVMIAAFLILSFEIYPTLKDRGTPGIITMTGLVIVFMIVYMTAVAVFIVPYDPFTLNVGPLLSPPSAEFPLGTTSLGQDLLSRTIAGGAIMLQVAIISVTICFSIGVPVGLLAAYRGGTVDRVTSLIMDSIFALPGLVLAIAIAAMLSPGVVNMALAIAVVYIPSYYRVVRSQVLTVKELPYVEAAIVMGAKERDIILRYVLPNVISSSIIVMSINFADAVLTAAGLTFVGLGLPIDVPDWGWDLTFGSAQLSVGAWWVITFPGLMIVLLALGFTLVGEGLNELLTPKLQE